MATIDPAIPPRIKSWHPLESFSWFRRWPPSALRDLVYTFIWNLGVWVVLVMVPLLFRSVDKMGELVWISFVLSNTIGFSIHFLFDLGRLLLGQRLTTAPTWLRSSYFIAIPVVGVFVGYGIGFALLDLHSALHWLFSPTGARSTAVIALLVSSLMFSAFVMRDRQNRAEIALAVARQQALDADRRALEAQLRMLQAQIEPHFLYNTLANAVGLIGPAPEQARLLLERLIDYLRASLQSSRERHTELGRELATLSAYLDLMRVRMGERLSYRIELPPGLERIAIPPMLLQPLVENAIQHGLEPQVAGGEIVISVVQQDGELCITVADTGQGIDINAKPRPGGGVGLVNLRERLASLYGPAGSLTLIDNQPRGVKAVLRLPGTQTHA